MTGKNQIETEVEGIKEVRERLVLRLQYVGLVFGLLALASLLPLYPSVIQLPALLAFSGVYVSFVLIFLFRLHLSYQVRAVYLAGILFITGALGLASQGLLSLGIPILVLVPVITTLLLGRKSGIASVAICVVYVGVIGSLTVYGILDPHLNAMNSVTSWGIWANAVAGTLFLASLTIAVLDSVNSQLTNSLHTLKHRAQELDHSNSLLENEMAQREASERELNIKNAAIDSTMSAAAFCDLEGTLTYANDAIVQLWGYKNKEDVIGKNTIEFWKDPQAPFQVIEEVIEKGSSRGEMEALRKDGTVFIARYTANTVYDEHGQPMCLMALFDDVTDQTRIKTELTEENAWRRVILEASSTLNAQLDFSHSFKSVANALREIIPVDHMMVILKKDQQAVFEVVETRENDTTTIQTGVGVPYTGSFLEHMEAEGRTYIIDDLESACNFAEEEIIHRDGLRSCARLPLYESGKFLGMLALSSHQPSAFNQSHILHLETLALQVAHTVANIQRYQQARGDAERLALIVREVHHRIKNNLQGVIGLFDRYCEDQPELAPVMNAAISQLYSVAEVHNLLSHNSNETVSWHSLIQGVCTVTGHLSPHSLDYDLKPETAKLTIAASEAVPMALAINELILNAINHGYPDGRLGVIQINTDHVPEKEGVRLVVSNDGVSPPHSINRHDTQGVGIGLELVRSLLPDNADFLLHRKQDWTVAEITIPNQTFNKRYETLKQ